LVDAVIDRINAWSRGEEYESIWSASLKSELRKIQKIENGETRVFTIPPLDYTLAARALCLHWAQAMYGGCRSHRGYSTVGVDPDSGDWTNLYDKHTSFSPYVIPADHSDFDGTLDAQCVADVYEEISDWYDHYSQSDTFTYEFYINSEYLKIELSPEQARMARRMCGAEIYTTRLIAANTLIQKFGGNNSGNALTVLLNNKVNRKYIFAAFYNHFASKGYYTAIRHFDDLVRLSTYGDDILISVAEPARLQDFDFYAIQKYLADHNLTITAADKSDNPPPFIPFEQATFLKQGFVPDSRFPYIIHPQMELDTIFELTNWITTTIPKKEAIRTNCTLALEFAYHHGRSFYNALHSDINAALAPACGFILPNEFDTLDRAFLFRCGKA